MLKGKIKNKEFLIFFSLKGPLRNGQKNVEPEQKNFSDGENSYSLLTKVRGTENNSVE